ncbi:MAG: outer membrane beta-barrel protein [Porticoccaceae bacterium]|nr:outer membrane beta-barrel protein [Porticoccaceae bacterium]
MLKLLKDHFSFISVLVLGITGLMLLTPAVLAYEAGDIIVRAGVASVQPVEDSDPLEINGVAAAGTKAGVDNNEQLGLTLTWMLDAHWGIGVLAATPFEHDLSARGLGVDAGSVKQLPPTITLQYFPMHADCKFQPYVGLGVNYTKFFDEDIDSELEGVLGAGDLELDDSFGLAAQAGVDYAINDHWLLNASVWYLDIDTTADFNFDSGVRVKADVEVDPWVYMVGLGYKF